MAEGGVERSAVSNQGGNAMKHLRDMNRAQIALVAVGLSVTTAWLGAGIIGTIGSHPAAAAAPVYTPAPVPTQAAPDPVPTQAAPDPVPVAQTAPADPAPAAPAAPAAPDPMTAWCAGPAGSAEQAALADLNQAESDSAASDLAAVESDGAQLATDAGQAARPLPPGLTNTQTLDYGLAMGYLMAAGNDMANGNVTAATAALQKANGFITDDAGVLGC
jgi:hypothetical protein